MKTDPFVGSGMSGVCEGKLVMSLWYECQNLFLSATFACALLNGNYVGFWGP